MLTSDSEGSEAPEFFTGQKKKVNQPAGFVFNIQEASGSMVEPIGLQTSPILSPSPTKKPSSSPLPDLNLTLAPKKMTLMQVDELVSELFETKLQSDINHLNNRLPKKTMEGHMNEIFMNKFGVKKVVIENIQSFVYHLRYYSARNSKFRAFSHILRNECEEEFIHALKTVEKTLAFLLKVAV